ncbi:hypothetical protein SBA7_1610004 [Candidatus Sulfotelmatobacter sp. SbA7]|nr:hypothetical protein SBA7_1610004 [Candidatus Sulfotelmatobacter sp. SbA7]
MKSGGMFFTDSRRLLQARANRHRYETNTKNFVDPPFMFTVLLRGNGFTTAHFRRANRLLRITVVIRRGC